MEIISAYITLLLYFNLEMILVGFGFLLSFSNQNSWALIDFSISLFSLLLYYYFFIC